MKLKEAYAHCLENDDANNKIKQQALLYWRS